MFRRRGVAQTLHTVFTFVTATAMPGVMALQVLGLLSLPFSNNACKWMPGMRMFRRPSDDDDDGACVSGLVSSIMITLAVLLSVVFVTGEVNAHLLATTVMRHISADAVDDTQMRASQLHMQQLKHNMDHLLVRNIDTFHAEKALRDLGSIATGGLTTEDVPYAIGAATYEEDMRRAALDLNGDNIMSSARRNHGGSHRQFTFEQTLARLKKGGKHKRGGQAYRWLQMRRPISTEREFDFFDFPRMPFTFADVYEADYNLRKWKDRNNEAKKNQHTTPPLSNGLDFLLSYWFPTTSSGWLNIDAKAIESLHTMTDGEVAEKMTQVAKQLESRDGTLPNADFGPDDGTPMGLDATNLVMCMTAFMVPRPWTRL